VEAPLDDLIGPMIGGFVEPGIFELEKMLDDVFAE